MVQLPKQIYKQFIFRISIPEKPENHSPLYNTVSLHLNQPVGHYQTFDFNETACRTYFRKIFAMSLCGFYSEPEDTFVLFILINN